MRTTSGAPSSANAAGLHSVPPHTPPSPRPGTGASNEAEQGASGWYETAANMGRSVGNALYALYARQPQQSPTGTPVSPAAQDNPKAELAKELHSAEAMEAFLKTNAAGKINTLFEGKGKNLVHITAQHGSPEALGVVLQHVAKMDEAERKAILNANSTALGMTPLGLAAFVGPAGAVELLMNTPGVDLNKPNDLGKPPLTCAEQGNNIAAIKLLLSKIPHGLDPDIRDKEDRTALMNAVVNGHGEALAALAEHVDVNTTDKFNNRTALMYAEQLGNSAAFHTLLHANGADLRIADGEGRSVLNRAAVSGNSENIVAILSHPSADTALVNAQDRHGNTALQNAVINGNEKAFDALAASPHAELNAPDKEGRTPVSIAAVQGHIGLLKKMLANPAFEVDKAGPTGLTPFLHAASKGQEKVVDLFLKEGVGRVNFNAQHQTGLTPLAFAGLNGHWSVFDKLMQHEGVDPNFKVGGYDLLAAAMAMGNTPAQLGTIPLANVVETVRRLVDNERVTGDREAAKQWLAAHDSARVS